MLHTNNYLHSICTVVGIRGKREGMAPHSNTAAWKIPWTEETARPQSMGSLRMGHDWAIWLSLFTFMHWRRKWQPIPVFLPGESQGRGAWWAATYGVAQSWTWLKRLSSSTKDDLKYMRILHHCDPSYSCAFCSSIGLLGSALGCPSIRKLNVVSIWMPHTQWNQCQHTPYQKSLILPFAKFEGTKLSVSNCPECQLHFCCIFWFKKTY